MAAEAAILGRGEFYKVVGEGLYTRFTAWQLYLYLYLEYYSSSGEIFSKYPYLFAG